MKTCSTLEEVRANEISREREILSYRMSRDPYFSHLRCIQRDHTHIGRMFVLWEVHDGEPRIRALLRTRDFELNTHSGLQIAFQVVEPGRDQPYGFTINSYPRRLGTLPLYLWMPLYNQVRFLPVNPANPTGSSLLAMTLMSKTESGGAEGFRLEGQTYFTPAAKFNEIWPAFAII